MKKINITPEILRDNCVLKLRVVIDDINKSLRGWDIFYKYNYLKLPSVVIYSYKEKEYYVDFMFSEINTPSEEQLLYNRLKKIIIK